jgi:type I restriction enzyme S subunit
MKMNYGTRLSGKKRFSVYSIQLWKIRRRAKMSKLYELIQELCPDGVAYKSIKDVYQRLKGTPITAAKMKEIEKVGGDIRVFAGGKTVIDAYEADIPKANITRVPAVLVQSRGVIDFIYYDKPFTFKNEMWSYTHKEKTAVKYLYYVLKNNMEKFREAASGMGSLPQISLKVTEDFLIPLPPLPVQCEIVRILDSYTERVEQLTAELTVELAARQKQYEYYRNKLLIFSTEIPVVQLAQIADIGTGSSNTNEEMGEGEYPFYVRSQEPLRKNEYEFDEIAIITAGDGVGVGKVFHYVEGKYALHQRAYRIHINTPTVYPKYFFYYMKSAFLPYIEKTMFQGSVPSIRRPMLNAFPVPIPPLEIQQRLVNVLDNFDAICSDLNIGLPAEIEARQKQYEFYRDSLLTCAATGKTILTDRQTEFN